MFESYEDYFNINLPMPELDIQSLNWVQYNPRKNVNRWGVSLTSLDGESSGIPDLDSLYEYNRINNTKYCESDFNKPTPIFAKSFGFLSEHFELGRSHIIRLGVGGFFPYHRDLDQNTFRLIYTFSGCQEASLVWILDNQIIRLNNHRWYYINTKKVHSVFSFFGSEFAVFNVIANAKTEKAVLTLLSIK